MEEEERERQRYLASKVDEYFLIAVCNIFIYHYYWIKLVVWCFIADMFIRFAFLCVFYNILSTVTYDIPSHNLYFRNVFLFLFFVCLCSYMSSDNTWKKKNKKHRINMRINFTNIVWFLLHIFLHFTTVYISWPNAMWNLSCIWLLFYGNKLTKV